MWRTGAGGPAGCRNCIGGILFHAVAPWGIHKTRQVVNVTIGVVTHNAFAETKNVAHTKIVAQMLFDVGFSRADCD